VTSLVSCMFFVRRQWTCCSRRFNCLDDYNAVTGATISVDESSRKYQLRIEKLPFYHVPSYLRTIGELGIQIGSRICEVRHTAALDLLKGASLWAMERFDQNSYWAYKREAVTYLIAEHRLLYSVAMLPSASLGRPSSRWPSARKTSTFLSNYGWADCWLRYRPLIGLRMSNVTSTGRHWGVTATRFPG